MSEKLSLIIEATDNASSVLGGIGKTLGNLGRVAGGLALGGIAALGAGVVKFASDGLSLNNSMEKVTAQLNAFTKDGAKTASIIDTVRERAAKTPFEFDAMAKAAVALFPASKTAAGGLNAILEKAEILAASNPAEGLEGAAFALKEAVSGDFTSIIERFNLPRQFINDLKKEGVPNLEIVQRAMKEMGLDVDLVSNLANTAEGRWSTFKDTIAGVAATATKPIFDAMSTGIAGVNGLLEANTPLLNQVGATIAGVLTQGIAGLSAVLPQIIAGFSLLGAGVKFFSEVMRQAFGGEQLDAAEVFMYTLKGMGIELPEILKTVLYAIEDGFDEIPEIIGSVGAAFDLIGMQIAMAMISIQPALDGILQSVSSIFGSLIPIALTAGMGAWTMISTTIQTVITSAISIIQTWLPVVQTVLGGIAAFLTTHGTQIQLLISTAWNTVTTIIQTAINTAVEVVNAFAPVVLAVFGEISAFLNANGADILATMTSVWEGVGAIVKTVSEIVKATVIPAFTAIAGFIKDHGAEIQAVFSGAWSAIKTVVASAVDIIKGVLSAGLAIIRGDWAGAWKEIQGVTQTSNNLIQTVINTAMGLIEGVINLAVNNFKMGWEKGWQLMQTATSTAMTLIKDAINTGIETAKTVIANGVEAFIAKFNNLKDKMSVIGQQLLEGMVQGIRDKVGWLVDEGVRAANAVLSAIKSTLGIHSPSREGEEITYQTIAGLANEWAASGDTWVDAAVDTTERMIERVRVAIEPMPDIVGGAATQTAVQTVSAFSGLADGVEDQLLTVAESFVELAQTGDVTSLNFAQAFDAVKRKFAELTPTFGDVQKNFDVLFATMASGEFDVQTFWDAWGKMLHEVKIGTAATLEEVNRGLLNTYIVFEDGSYTLKSLEEKTQASFQHIAETVTTNTNIARDAVNNSFENILVVAGVAINTLTGEVVNSSNTMSTAMDSLANRVTGVTQTMQTQASAAAQSIATSMIAAGEVINTTQAQLANFIQSGGIGGITGGTYTPSQAFQDSFRNPPAVAAPRPSSVPKPTVTNNTPINITITGGNVDRYAVEDGTTAALRRAGLLGRFS